MECIKIYHPDRLLGSMYTGCIDKIKTTTQFMTREQEKQYEYVITSLTPPTVQIRYMYHMLIHGKTLISDNAYLQSKYGDDKYIWYNSLSPAERLYMEIFTNTQLMLTLINNRCYGDVCLDYSVDFECKDLMFICAIQEYYGSCSHYLGRGIVIRTYHFSKLSQSIINGYLLESQPDSDQVLKEFAKMCLPIN